MEEIKRSFNSYLWEVWGLPSLRLLPLTKLDDTYVLVKDSIHSVFPLRLHAWIIPKYYSHSLQNYDLIPGSQNMQSPIILTPALLGDWEWMLIICHLYSCRPNIADVLSWEWGGRYSDIFTAFLRIVDIWTYGNN